MTIWERFWQSSTRALDACERQRQRRKEPQTTWQAQRQTSRKTCLSEGTLIHGGGGESKCEDATPRDSSASNDLAERAIRTFGEQLRTLRYDTQNRHKTRITSTSIADKTRAASFASQHRRLWLVSLEEKLRARLGGFASLRLPCIPGLATRSAVLARRGVVSCADKHTNSSMTPPQLATLLLAWEYGSCRTTLGRAKQMSLIA